MRYFSLILLALVCLLILGFTKSDFVQVSHDLQSLRSIYSSGDPTKWPKAELHSSVDPSTFVDIGVMSAVVHPGNNPYSKEKADLGKLLFFDPRLSSSGQISCANCHNPELSWTDRITRSFGHNRQTGTRNAMTILNVAYAETLFWDGRAASLEEQSLLPIIDPLEMNEHIDLAISRIFSIEGYQKLFKEAFPGEDFDKSMVQRALATFQRTIVSPKSKFDRFISGNKDAFSDNEVLGLHLFRTKAMCINCHNTPYFSDNKFHNDGQTLQGTKNEDLGRYYFTKNKEDIGKFKTPTLREVGRTGPWMHHGHFPTLLDVVQFYNLGNPAPIQRKYIDQIPPELLAVNSPILRPLGLTREEENALVAFLETLSTPVQRMKMPDLPQ